MKSHIYYVYILASKRNGTLYIGVTSNLYRRTWEHKLGIIAGFTKKYHVKLLVYFEEYTNSNEAIAREKYLKGKSRRYKVDLIEKKNPQWIDLYQNFM